MIELANKYQTKEKLKEFIKGLVESQDNEVILIEVTRKGYWSEKAVNIENDGEFIKCLERKKVKIYSDRYLMKCLDFEEFRDKTVIIFDDVGNNGIQLFFYYALLRKNGAGKVIPAVYALNIEYPFVENKSKEELENSRKKEFLRTIRNQNLEEDEINSLFREYEKGFEDSFRWCIWMNPGDLGKFTVAETIWFQKAVLPMVVDLPMFRTISTKSDKEILLTNTQWETLCQGNNKWKQIPLETELAGEQLHYGYFQMQDHTLYSKLKNLFFNCIVRYKYEPIENTDQIKFVFVPFAILNSCRLSDMVWNFFHLFEESKYAKRVIDTINKENNDNNRRVILGDSYQDEDWEVVFPVLKKNHNMCRALYRAIIFDISNYIGYLFQEYVSERIGLELEYDWKIMEENLENDFILSIKEKYKNMNSDKYYTKLISCRVSEAISPRFFDAEELVVKRTPSVENLDLYLTGLLHRKRKNHDRDMNNRMVTLESMISEVDKRFVFQNAEQFREILTSYIVEMTENSRIGNEIYVDDTMGILYRGFRAGENCEILLKWGVEWVYPYVLAFYQKSEEKYEENYDRFAELLENEFREKKFIGRLISEVAFDFYKKYFKNVANNPSQILNKQYLMDKNGNSQKYGMQDFIHEAYRTVAYWNV